MNLDCKLDLKAIALQARNAEYNPKVFSPKYKYAFSLVLEWKYNNAGLLIWNNFVEDAHSE